MLRFETLSNLKLGLPTVLRDPKLPPENPPATLADLDRFDSLKSVWKDYPDIKDELTRLDRQAADMLQLDNGPQDLNPAPGVVVTRATSPQVDNILTVKAGETRLVTRQKELFACSTWEYVTNGQESTLGKRFEGRDWNDDHVVVDKAYEYHPGLGTITVHEA